MGKVTAAHLLVRTLRRHGIERIFGLCGDHVNSIFNACIDEGVAIVDTRQESGAAHMADSALVRAPTRASGTGTRPAHSTGGGIGRGGYPRP
jgi:thiamine pyrophosphate-dependent acetolactate synthase large subunit-like protein